MLECPCGVDWKADKRGDQVSKEVNREVVYWTRYRNQGSELVGVMMMVLLEVVVQMVVMVEVDREAILSFHSQKLTLNQKYQSKWLPI